MTTETAVGEPVLVSRAGSVLTVTLNRPHRRNALDVDAWARLERALRDARADESVRVLVITGTGGAFCAGADLKGVRPEGHPLSRMRWYADIVLSLYGMPKPVIAKVDGVAVGAGWNLALGCDLVVASTTARFAQIFARRGLSLDWGGSWILPRLVGLQQAKRLALLADFVDAEEALRLGLVTWVKPPGELDGFVDALARRLADGPPIALAQSKLMLNEAAALPLREALENEARAQAVNYATDGPAAGRAFANGTEPVFEGKWLL